MARDSAGAFLGWLADTGGRVAQAVEEVLFGPPGAAAGTGPAGAAEPAWARVFRAVDTGRWAEAVRAAQAEAAESDPVRVLVRAAERFRARIEAETEVEPDLPDLEEQPDGEIVADNVRALQALYFAAMLEELRLFQVVEKLVERFQQGLLPLGRGSAANRLYAWWKNAPSRLSEAERRNLYARFFGLPGGDDALAEPNREFDALFLRFCASVSAYVRQNAADAILSPEERPRIGAEEVRQAARELALNLSLHGYGIAHFAAAELQGQIQDVIEILSEPEIRNAYGARDLWQVVDRVAALELGGARNSIRYRTMATAGAVILRWLAERARRLAAGSVLPMLDLDVVRRPSADPHRRPADPSDRDLVEAVEQWLAVTGVPES